MLNSYPKKRKLNKMQAKKIFYSLIALFLITSCSNNSETENIDAVGGKMYGGELKFMSSEKVQSLAPYETIDVFSARVVSQIYEPLFKANLETMEVEPAIAESFSVNGSATEYTIKIKKGIKFHENDCFSGGTREVNANDVKFMFDVACSGLEGNQVNYLLTSYIKGAQDYMNKTSEKLLEEGVPGVKVVDNNTIKISLENPFTGLDKVLSHSGLSIFPKEAYEKYGSDFSNHPVGTGPFALESMNDDKLIMKRNPNYWKKDNFGNQLPFLDKISMTFSKNKKSELLAFRKKEIDMVLEIPVEEIEHILGSLQDAIDGLNVKHKVENESSLSMAYLAFACQSEEFKDPNVRKAFNYAINRQAIVDEYLEGEGYPALNGFVPPMETYPNKKVKGFEYNPELAKELLAKAGYGKGKKFPKLSVYVNAKEGTSIHKMVQGIVHQLNKNLNINLNIKLCTIKERNEAINNGKAKIWRTGWIADYPDAENFLSMFYSGHIHGLSMLNGFKFKNAEFDKLYLQALRELNPDKRNDILTKCDQIIVDQSPVMPILTDDFIVMVNARVRDFKTNSMETLDFTKVFIKEPRD